MEPPRTLRFTWPLGSHSNWIAWPPFAGVKHTQGYPTTKKSEPQSFGFPPQFPARVGRFFINWSVTFSAVYPKPVLQGPLVNAVPLWKVGFPSQSPIGLGGFSSTSLSHHIFRIEFQIACILPGYGAALALAAIAKRFLFLTLQSVGFPSQFLTRLGSFLSMAVYQTIILIFRFFLLSFH